MNLYLEVQVSPKVTSPREAIEDAIAVAKRIGIPVHFDWRYVRVQAYPNDNPDALYAEFEKAGKCVGLNTLATLHR